MSDGFISQLVTKFQYGGWPWLSNAIRHRLTVVAPRFAPAVLAMSQNRIGLEIGGPSKVFRKKNILPVYACAARIDNVNFASGTAWESGLSEGGDFIFNPGKPPGRQYLREATRLTGLPDAAYDFVLSSHCLEHVANPLAALREWWRVTCVGGHLILILPDPPSTFDHRRPVTSLDHLLEDFTHSTTESDLTHLPEILNLHDLTRDPAAGSLDKFKARGLNNAESRCLHHHVFDLELIRSVLDETGWDVLEAEKVKPMHLVALARKRTVG